MIHILRDRYGLNFPTDGITISTVGPVDQLKKLREEHLKIQLDVYKRQELLLLTEQMQEELDQKDRTIRELKVQLDESLTLNERLNSENRAGNIQALSLIHI